MKIFFQLFFGGMVLLFFISSCDKPVYKYNSDFEGTWRTPVIYDTILSADVMSEIIIDGKDGSFKNTCSPCGTELCNCVSIHVGNAVVNSSKTQMKIGTNNSFPLTIDEEPYVDASGSWTMKIHNLRYYRQ